MQRLVVLVAFFPGLVVCQPGSAQTYVSNQVYSPSVQQQTYVCPQCGRVHTHPISSPVQRTSYQQPSSYQPPRAYQPAPASQRTSSGGSSLHAGGGVVNVLSNLNAQRSRQGLFSLTYDPQLQAVAERRARQMAAAGYKNHPPGSFAPGRYEGVGWSSSYSPSKVSACYTSDTRMRYAGAAMATGRDGVYFAVVYR